MSIAERNGIGFPSGFSQAGGLALLALVLLSGCRPDPNAEFKLYPVHGRVVFADGRPLPGKIAVSLLSLEQKNVQSIVGQVSETGEFSEVLFLGIGGDGRPGTVAGKHRVQVQLVVPIGEAAASLSAAEQREWAARKKLFERYSTFSRSDLVVEVRPGENDVLIELVAPPSRT